MGAGIGTRKYNIKLPEERSAGCGPSSSSRSMRRRRPRARAEAAGARAVGAGETEAAARAGAAMGRPACCTPGGQVEGAIEGKENGGGQKLISCGGLVPVLKKLFREPAMTVMLEQIYAHDLICI